MKDYIIVVYRRDAMAIGEFELVLIIIADTLASFLIGGFAGRTLTRFPFGLAGFTGVESMIGRKCVVSSVSEIRIEVTADSQVWRARSRGNDSFRIGDRAIVRDVDGLTLIIERAGNQN